MAKKKPKNSQIVSGDEDELRAPPRDDLTFNRAIDAVVLERQRQDEEWGGSAHDDTHINAEWVGFILKQAQRLIVGHKDFATCRRLFIAIAALAIAAAQSMERKEHAAKMAAKDKAASPPRKGHWR